MKRRVTPFLFAALLCAGIAGIVAGFAAGTARAEDAAQAAVATDDIFARARQMELWKHPQWLSLGHYRKKISGYKSEVDEPAFFLAADGKRNPEAELEATLRLFTGIGNLSEGARKRICRYPARLKWLRTQLDPAGTLLAAPHCPEMDDWKSKLNIRSLTMIFASAYLNSPASMYGHTFLRGDRTAGNKESSSLLSYSINFAADANDRNGFLFAVKGLFGGYPGRFSTVPYYMKLQTYSNIENRDLWEYRLNFTPEEIDRLLDHLWELGDSYFDYFFTSENCSYQLLPLLETARPELDLSRKFWLRAVPIDTVRALLDIPGLVVERTMRRSASRKMKETRNALAGHEVRAAERIADDPESNLPSLLDAITEQQKGRVMLSAYQYFRYRRGFSRYQDEKSDVQERKILLTLSELNPPKEAEVQDGTDEEDPALGHRSTRIGFSAGQREDSWVGEVSIRPALHDLLDNPNGYIPHNRLEMMNLALRYGDANEKAFIRQFMFLDILSLSPMDRWYKKPSWGVKAGLDSRRDARHQDWDTTYLRLNTNSGVSFSETVLGRDVMVYGLGQVDTGAGPAFEKGYRFSLGFLSGMTVNVCRWLKVLGEIDYKQGLAGDKGRFFGFKVVPAVPLGRNAQLRFTYEQEESIREFLLSFHLYL